MKKLLPILLAAILALALVFAVSCRPQPDFTEYHSYSEYTRENPFKDWGTLFDAFWAKMNTNYVFWDLDDKGDTDWDAVYEKYAPEFKSFGSIYETEGDLAGYFNPNSDSSQKALENLFYITKNLTDGHFSIDLWLKASPQGPPTTLQMIQDSETGDFYYRVPYSPSYYRIMDNLYTQTDGTPIAHTDDDIYHVLVLGDTMSSTTREQIAEAADISFAERSNEIIYYTLTRNNTLTSDDGSALFTVSESGAKTWNIGEAGEDNFMDISDPNTGKTMRYFRYTVTETGVHGGELYGALGEVADGIVYFGFNGFNFFPYTQYQSTIAMPIVNRFREMVTDPNTKGVIIDLRGNGGGDAPDLSLLWNVFFNGEDLTAGIYRRKGGDNRTDYGPWAKHTFSSTLTGDTRENPNPFNKDVPIVLLTNGYSGSCSELTILIFEALKDQRNYNVQVIGETSGGAFGAITDTSNGMFNSGSFINMGQLRAVMTPFEEFRYYDGTSYEGVGFTPNTPVKFTNYTDFINQGAATDYKADLKLQAALDWLGLNKQ